MDFRVLIWILIVGSLLFMFVMTRFQTVRNERAKHRFFEIESVDDEFGEYLDDDDD